MVILIAFTIGMTWWVAAWALGVKSFDFMVTALIVVVAAAWYVARPFIQSFTGRSEPGRPG
jgi:hypothetical protein